MKIPFNIPCVWGDEQKNLKNVIERRKFSGKGNFVQKSSNELKIITGAKEIFFTPSCTSALEMCSLILDIQLGDEIILPAFTHVASANPFIQKGAKIVWCDIRKDTKNIDEVLLESLITKRTKAVVIVHYGGVACEMDRIVNICKQNNISLIEDAAMAIGAKYKGKPLGSFGDLAVISFHETKNIQCGEGGVLLVNNPKFFEKAVRLYDRGTNRREFENGKADFYTWTMSSSNFLMPELTAAFLYSQLIHLSEINRKRLEDWKFYYARLADFLLPKMLPIITKDVEPNGHTFYLVLSSENERNNLIAYLKRENIQSVFHYIPLHHAPFWEGKYSQVNLQVTDRISKTIIRLPLYFEIRKEEIEKIIYHLRQFFVEKS